MSVSIAKKRAIAGLIGMAYAVVYGFWTMVVTGVGQGNIIWFLMFFFAGCFGLYYPLMAILAYDLRGRFIRSLFGGLLCFHLIASVVILVGWITAIEPDGPSDFIRAINRSGLGQIVIDAALHFWPTIVFAVLLGRALTGGGTIAEDDGSPIGLDPS
ncbi:MAG: hypothetical protein AB7Q37_04040 [Pyrinomonadaceae bacterium]